MPTATFPVPYLVARSANVISVSLRIIAYIYIYATWGVITSRLKLFFSFGRPHREARLPNLLKKPWH